jgi:hypothetical protein
MTLLGLTSPGLARGVALAVSGPPLAMQEVAPAASAAPLVNPGMGIYLDGTLDPSAIPDSAWFAPWARIGYFQEDWATLEPDAEGRYRFDDYFGRSSTSGCNAGTGESHSASCPRISIRSART